MTPDAPLIHRMLPGTHEWPRTPQCRCGSDYDYWGDRCPRDTKREEEA